METEQIDAKFEKLSGNVEQLFFVVIGMLLFSEHCGFAFSEYEAMRIKNTTNILEKICNVLLLRSFTRQFDMPLQTETTENLLSYTLNSFQ